MRKFLEYIRYQDALGIKEVILPYDTKTLMKTKSVIAKRGPLPTVGINSARRSQSISSEIASVTPRNDTSLPNSLKELEKIVSGCVQCRLSEARTQTVFGVGNPKADIMFVGEGPGRDEDLKGEPFVGRAGQLLTKIIQAMGFERKDVYIANIVKCRPPNNRGPLPDEVGTCTPYLLKQIELIKPQVIVALGSYAARFLLNTETPISQLRGQFFDFHGTKLIPTFHPAFLLRNPAMKKPVWEDMKKVMKLHKELHEKK